MGIKAIVCAVVVVGLSACGELRENLDPQTPVCAGTAKNCLAPTQQARSSPDRVQYDPGTQSFAHSYDFVIDVTPGRPITLALDLTYADFGAGPVPTRFTLAPRLDFKVEGQGCNPVLRSVNLLFNDGNTGMSGTFVEGLAPATHSYDPARHPRPQLEIGLDSSGLDSSGCTRLRVSMTLQARRI